eukprot:CAMPEP_0195518138 /NCGR_PEP_ID=MMETSP0794_2-20130614/12344_1 /TAXON_ID=515487 /ORGANISM="Stephanopyxis turris, Strain CCMP 815" /LENGTH=241 /DNA_ID=CAMNT_0040647057 /DNA_START=246 /DNA_END=971 /DNA_ORIENTATION=+
MNRKGNFPEILMEMISSDEVHDTISWTPSGTSFAIHHPKHLANHVLPKYFGQATFQSFTRKLNRWGFRKIIQGREKGGFYHELFQRDSPHLCQKITSSKRATPSSGEYRKGVNSLNRENRQLIRELSHGVDVPNHQRTRAQKEFTCATFFDPQVLLLEHQRRIAAARQRDLNNAGEYLLLSRIRNAAAMASLLQCNDLTDSRPLLYSQANLTCPIINPAGVTMIGNPKAQCRRNQSAVDLI